MKQAADQSLPSSQRASCAHRTDLQPGLTVADLKAYAAKFLAPEVLEIISKICARLAFRRGDDEITPRASEVQHVRNVWRWCSIRRSFAWISANISVGRTPKVQTPGFDRDTGLRSTPGQKNSLASSRTIHEASASRPRCRLTFGGIAILRASPVGV